MQTLKVGVLGPLEVSSDAAVHTTSAIDPLAAAANLGAALRLWRGTPVAELAKHPLGRAEATSLEETPPHL